MTFVNLVSPAIAFLLLAAHFFRSTNVIGVVVAVLMIALLFVRRPFAARVAQIALALGAAEWVRSTVVLIQERSAAGVPYLRLALILGAVAVFTLLAALVFQSRRMKGRYRLDGGDPTPRETKSG